MHKATDLERDTQERNRRRMTLQSYARRSDAVGRGRDHWGRMGLHSADEFNALVLRSKALVDDIPYAIGEAQGPPVTAFVNDNRWMARCECGGLAVVDPDDPRFYCHHCLNVANGGVPLGKDAHGGYPRPVWFPAPAEIDEIEQTLLASDDPLWRNWTPYPEDEANPGGSRRNTPPAPKDVRQAITRAQAFNVDAGLPRKRVVEASDAPTE